MREWLMPTKLVILSKGRVDTQMLFFASFLCFVRFKTYYKHLFPFILY